MLGCAKITNSNIYTLMKFQHLEQKWTMVFYNKEVAIICSCKIMESAGILCRHIFHIMKFEQLVRIPPALILSRWTKSAKVNKVMKMTAVASHLDKEVLETTKFGSLLVACTNFCLFAVKNEQSYIIVLDEIQQLTLRVEQMVADDESAKRARNCVLQAGMKLKDPVTVNGKGCSKTVKHDGAKNRKCSKCFQPGHTKWTCPLYPPKDMQPNDLYCSVGGIGCVSTDDQPRHCSYNVLTSPVSMESRSPSSLTFTFETTYPWRHDISEGIDGHYDSSNTFGITYETDANTYYNWLPHNNL